MAERWEMGDGDGAAWGPVTGVEGEGSVGIGGGDDWPVGAIPSSRVDCDGGVGCSLGEEMVKGRGGNGVGEFGVGEGEGGFGRWQGEREMGLVRGWAEGRNGGRAALAGALPGELEAKGGGARVVAVAGG